MKRNHHWSVFLYLVGLLAALLLPASGCLGRKTPSEHAPSAGWFSDMRERILDDFDDPGQVAALMAVVDQMEATMNDLDQSVIDYYADLRALDRDYGTTREQFQEAIDAFNDRQRVVFEKILAHAGELKQISGREGWKKLADIDHTLFESWQREM